MKWGAVLLALAAVSPACKSALRHTPRFDDVARQTGLDFWHSSGATGDFLLPEITGSGGALLDYDNDGDLDVYLVQGAPLTVPVAGKLTVPLPPGWKPGNRLFRNNLARTGKLSWRFRSDGKIPGSPTVHERAVYFGATDGCLYAVSID